MTEQRSKTEPRAELRQAASELWQMHVALTHEGFTDMQSLVIIGQVMASSAGGDK